MDGDGGADRCGIHPARRIRRDPGAACADPGVDGVTEEAAWRYGTSLPWHPPNGAVRMRVREIGEGAREERRVPSRGGSPERRSMEVRRRGCRRWGNVTGGEEAGVRRLGMPRGGARAALLFFLLSGAGTSAGSASLPPGEWMRHWRGGGCAAARVAVRGGASEGIGG